MRAVFVDESFHQKNTRSSQFFIDIIKEAFDEVIITTEETKIAGLKADCVILWQRLFPPQEIDHWQAKSVVMCPMFDACPHELDWWRQYKKYKVFCFSKTLYDMLHADGFDCLYSQYYIKPAECEKSFSGSVSGFFWERNLNLTWKTVSKVCEKLPVEKMHFHTGLTFNKDGIERPSQEDIGKYKMKFTSWFQDKNEMTKILETTDLYFAPRISEGIGLSFIEALAYGCVVAAYDAPTMNEYITDGIDGILFDYDRFPSENVSIARFKEMQEKSKKRAAEGYEKWCSSIPAIKEFLLEPVENYMPQKSVKVFFHYIMLHIKNVVKFLICWEKIRPLVKK